MKRRTRALIAALALAAVPGTAAAADGSAINSGDTAWMLVATALVMLMLPGLAISIAVAIVVLLAGTNNVGSAIPAGTEDAVVADITKGMQAVVTAIRNKSPDAIVIITAIFPRNDNMAVMHVINKINGNLEKMAEGGKVRFLSINDQLADSSGRIFDGMLNADKLHPTAKAYQVWADALKPIFRELLGPPGTESLNMIGVVTSTW